jgi:predicted nucleic acid-binding protein
MTKRIAFDTTIFIAYFEQQQIHPLDVIANMVDEVDGGRALLIVPTVVIAELFCKGTNTQLVDAFLRNPSVLVTDLTEPAAKLAGSVRDDCISNLGFKPGMPDTLIAATAQFGIADTLYTVDDPMLRLDRSALFTIGIKRPEWLNPPPPPDPQIKFDFPSDDDEK